MKIMQKTSSHYSKTALKRRGWNDELIEQFLGPTDKTPVNMKYRSGPRLQLYKAKRVHSVESQQEFIEIQQKRLKRRQAAQKAVATKREQMRRALDAIEYKVPEMKWDILTHRAIDHYNVLHSASAKPAAGIKSNERFLDRIRVNYLRHELTEYENHFLGVAGKVGAGDAYPEIKQKVLDAIAEVYPKLRAECNRQAQQAYDNSP